MANKFLENCRAYEIYPVTFFDSNGDGIGDLQGIIQKLDYLEKLNVNLIWLNPCYMSPFRDGGYDITDYFKIDPRFGTNDDMQELIDKAAQRGIKIMLDLVLGHTSDQHEWFKKSAEIDENEYSDLYIWNKQLYPSSDARDGTFILGCSERPGSYRINYYAHQPALNFGYYKPNKPWQFSYKSKAALKNRKVVVDVIKFWLAKGVAGYRVDMANEMVKNDPQPLKKGNVEFWNDVIGEVRQEYPESIFMPEWHQPHLTVGKSSFDVDCTWCGTITNYTNQVDVGNVYFTPDAKGSLMHYLTQLKFCTAAVRGRGYVGLMQSCHDCGRINKGYSDEMLKAIQVFARTMPVVSWCYMGEELGIPAREVRSKDAGYERTGARTPMQWTNGKNLGFSTADEIYLPVEADSSTHYTVEAQENDKNSLLNTVRKINGIRADYPCFNTSADLKVLHLGKGRGYPFVFERKQGNSRAVVVISPKNESVTLDMLKYSIDASYEQFYSNASMNGYSLTTYGTAFAVFYK